MLKITISQGDNMTRYIIMMITALLIVSCNTKSIVNSAAYTNDMSNSAVKVYNIPIECYDENGIFDSNRGHDALDCDNL